MSTSFEKVKEITDEEYLYFLVQPLCEFEIHVTRRVDELGVLLSLDLNPADMGMVIGKQGRTANAIRGLLRIFGDSHNARINMMINEPQGRARRPEPVSEEV